MQKFLISLVFLLFFMSMHASADTAVSDVGIKECAVNNGDIMGGDGTICEDDIAFGMLYELLPSLFNELLPYWNLSAFSNFGDEPNKPTLLGEYHGDSVFFILFQLFFKLVVYCLVIYGSVLTLSVLLRLLKGESLNDTNSGKDSPKSWVAGVAIGGGFLLPVKSFFLGQVILFSLAIGALSLANFGYSIFLSGNQAIFYQSANPTRVTEIERGAGVINRHLYISDSFYRYLTRMELCRTQSAKYQISAQGLNASSAEQYKQMYKCTAGETDTGKTVWDPWDGGGVPPFMWRNTSSSSLELSDSYLLKSLSEIEFKSEPSASNSCLINNEYSISFKCGSLNIHEPDWGKNSLIQLLDDPSELYFFLDKLASSLTPNLSADDIQSITHSQWNQFSKKLETSLISAWDKQTELADQGFTSIDNEVVRKGDALRDVILAKNQEIFNDAARLFHLHAMNIITVGQYRSYSQISGGRTRVISDYKYGTDTSNAINYHMSKASELANIVERGQCMDYGWGVEDTFPIKEFLSGDRDYLDGKSYARCFDVLKNEIIEYHENWDQIEPDALMKIARERYEIIRKEFVEKWDASITDFSNQRRAVEASYADVVNDNAAEDFWVKLRTQGYLSAANYAQSMSDITNNYKRDVTQIINNFEVATPSYGANYISDDLSGKYEIDSSFPSFLPGDEVMESTSLSGKSIDALVRNYHWVSNQEQIIRQPGLSTGGFNIDDIMDSFTNPLTYFDRLGLDLNRSGKSPEACLQDPKMCPFPLSDPVVELSLMGHDMVDMAISFYTVTLSVQAGMKIADITGNIADKMKSSSSPGSIEERFGDNVGTGKFGKLGSVLKEAGGMMALIYDLLGTIMGFFLALGLALAYILPLVPKLYLYMGFISWIMVVVMSFFSVLLLSLYWVRFKEKQDLIKSAGFHFGIELLFKPTFNLISVLFAWYFFYIVAFSVGVTIGWVWALPLDGNWLRAYTDTLFIIIIVGFVYFVGIRYGYQLMDDMSGALLEKLGVRNKKIKDEMSVFIKALLFDSAQRGWKSLHDKAGSFGRSDKGKDMTRLKNAQKVVDDMQRARMELRHGGQNNV